MQEQEQKSKTLRRLQLALAPVLLAVGFGGDVDFLISATAPGHWTHRMLTAIASSWVFLQPALMVCVIFGVLWLERKISRLALLGTQEKLDTVSADFTARFEGLVSRLDALAQRFTDVELQVSAQNSALAEYQNEISAGADRYMAGVGEFSQNLRAEVRTQIEDTQRAFLDQITCLTMNKLKEEQDSRNYSDSRYLELREELHASGVLRHAE